MPIAVAESKELKRGHFKVGFLADEEKVEEVGDTVVINSVHEGRQKGWGDSFFLIGLIRHVIEKSEGQATIVVTVPPKNTDKTLSKFGMKKG